MEDELRSRGVCIEVQLIFTFVVIKSVIICCELQTCIEYVDTQISWAIYKSESKQVRKLSA